ncbi:MAG TPA: hypothetical protein VFD95_11570 [Usitatibacter sp.]|nr:hypothetical protein [Usitatibacter sp.]
MSPPGLALDRVLARTAEGTRRLEVRDQTLSPKLRSALALVSGRQSLGELLDLAGGLAHVLDSQIRTLLELRLVVMVDRASAQSPQSDPLPLAAARNQILRRLAASEGTDVPEAMARIRASRSLSQLAEHARAAAVTIQAAAGRDAAEQFWAHAREVLLHWQGRAGEERA